MRRFINACLLLNLKLLAAHNFLKTSVADVLQVPPGLFQKPLELSESTSVDNTDAQPQDECDVPDEGWSQGTSSFSCFAFSQAGSALWAPDAWLQWNLSPPSTGWQGADSSWSQVMSSPYHQNAEQNFTYSPGWQGADFSWSQGMSFYQNSSRNQNDDLYLWQ